MSSSATGAEMAVVAPAWAEDLARRLRAVRFSSFAEALRSTPLERLVVVDQSERGEGVRNRRDAVDTLCRIHGALLVVGYSQTNPAYLRPFAEDGPVPQNLEFTGPDVTVGEIASWLGAPVSPSGASQIAFGADYLRQGVPVARPEPYRGFKRVFVAVDTDGRLAVAGAFALGFGPLDRDWVCGHEPPHAHLGPDCYDGFSAYRYREDALAFRAPDAAVAEVDLSGVVLSADSAVTKCGMRGEHQRVLRVEFPDRCACGRRATGLRQVDPDEDGFAELRPSCPHCAAAQPLRSLADVTVTGGIPVSWLETPAT